MVLSYFQVSWVLDRKPYPLPKDTSLWPSVDIFIPSYNEPLEVVKPCLLAALDLDWPKDKLKVHMLADGTVACATLHGDETFHYYMLLDGTPLRETQDGKYEKITAEELNTRKARVFSSANLTRASEIGTVRPSYFPHKGSPKALVLLVQFQDVKFKSKDPVATFLL